MVYCVSERERRAVVARRGGRVSVGGRWKLPRGVGIDIEDSDDVEVDIMNMNDPVL